MTQPSAASESPSTATRTSASHRDARRRPTARSYSLERCPPGTRAISGNDKLPHLLVFLRLHQAHFHTETISGLVKEGARVTESPHRPSFQRQPHPETDQYQARTAVDAPPGPRAGHPAGHRP